MEPVADEVRVRLTQAQAPVVRHVVTNIVGGSAQWLYDSPLANQVRLVLHTGAYWLMLKVRDAIPKREHSKSWGADEIGVGSGLTGKG